MARLYSHKRGHSGSTRPLTRKPPAWCKYTPEEVEALVLKLAREGSAPSTIGMMLRDVYGIPLVKPLVGKSIGKILAKEQTAGLPEDLSSLLKKADQLRRHLEKNRKDYVNKRSLRLVESKIHRLEKHYRSMDRLPADWKYKHVAASVA